MKPFSYVKSFVNNRPVVGYIIALVMLILAIADLLTARMNGVFILNAVETNPIYRVTKSLLLILVINVIMIVLYAYAYKHVDCWLRYFLITFFAWHSTIRIYAIRSNVLVYLNPPTPSQISLVTDSVKNTHYLAIILAILLPSILGLIIYALFRLDHSVSKK